MSVPTSKPWTYGPISFWGHETGRLAMFFSLRFFCHPRSYQIQASYCLHSHILAGGARRGSAVNSTPHPSAQFHGRRHENGHLARLFTLRIFRRPFFHHLNAPSCFHRPPAQAKALQSALFHSNHHPSAQFHGRGHENGLQMRILDQPVLHWPRQAPAATLSLNYSPAPPSAPPPVDCYEPMPLYFPITAAPERPQPGERG